MMEILTNPTVVGIGATVAALGGAAAYSYFTGNEAAVDTDGDGEDEVTFSGNVAETPEDDPREEETDKPPMYEEEPTETAVGPDLEAEALEDVTGVGPTRADDLREAEFETPEDLYYASDENLADVHGIGSLTISQIRGDIGGIDYEDGEEDAEDEDEDDETEDE